MIGLDKCFVAFSPHTWRCFPHGRQRHRHGRSFLHTRGGVSGKTVLEVSLRSFSPHTWRCFCMYYDCGAYTIVFSTHVEVFPTNSTSSTTDSSFLHTRGGVSSL